MNALKIYKVIAGTAVLAIALTQAPAQAAVDFNSDTPVQKPFGTIGSGGYDFSSLSYFGTTHGDAYPDYNFGVSNHSNMLFFSGGLTVTRSDNGLFSLGSLDVGGWANLGNNPGQLSITGHRLSGDVTISSALSTASFAQITTSPLFTNLTSLTLTTGGSYYAAIDNLALAPVPEPETYAMMLAGLGLLAIVARRRKNTKA